MLADFGNTPLTMALLQVDPALEACLILGAFCCWDDEAVEPATFFPLRFFFGLNFASLSLVANLKVSRARLKRTGWKMLKAPLPGRDRRTK